LKKKSTTFIHQGTLDKVVQHLTVANPSKHGHAEVSTH